MLSTLWLAWQKHTIRRAMRNGSVDGFLFTLYWDVTGYLSERRLTPLTVQPDWVTVVARRKAMWPEFTTVANGDRTYAVDHQLHFPVGDWVVVFAEVSKQGANTGSGSHGVYAIVWQPLSDTYRLLEAFDGQTIKAMFPRHTVPSRTQEGPR